jgi:hypothetical protein
MPSMVACRFNPILHQFAERLRTAGLPMKAVLCAVMHKLTHLIYRVIRTCKAFTQITCRKGLPFKKGLAIQDGIRSGLYISG